MEVSLPNGCGSKIGTANGTLVNGKKDSAVPWWCTFDPAQKATAIPRYEKEVKVSSQDLARNIVGDLLYEH